MSVCHWKEWDAILKHSFQVSLLSRGRFSFICLPKSQKETFEVNICKIRDYINIEFRFQNKLHLLKF